MTDDQPLYNSRILQLFISLLEKKYPHVDLRELLLHAGIMPYELSDEGHWFTQRQVDLFHEKATQLAGVDLAREAGRYAATATLGIMTKYVLGTIGPANAFFALHKSSSNFTRSTTYAATKLADNQVEIIATPAEGVEEKPYQCENRIGFFEAMIMCFNYEAPAIEHSECIFNGGRCCRYVITWKKTCYSRIRAIRNLLFPPLLALGVAMGFFRDWTAAGDMLAALAVAFLATSYFSERLEKKEIAAALSNLKQSTDSHLEQIGESYDNARMVNEVGQAISKQSDIDEVLENVIAVLEKRLGYDRCLILLADSKKTRLNFRTGFGYTEAQLLVLKNTFFNLTDPASQGVFVVSFREQRAIYVDDFSELFPIHSAKSISVSETLEAQSFICCAIVCEGESLGVLAVDNIKTRKKLMERDMSLMTGMAPVIGMSIRNAMYIDRERRMEEQIRQSQKMEAVGQLAGGVAHDFNNLLTAMIGFVTLAQAELDREMTAFTYLDQVLFAADRATNLTQGLLAFSRKQINNPQPVDLNVIVSNIRKLLSRLISAEIELDVSMSEQRLFVVADSGQIDQVLMNLVTNARDAMAGSGVLTIRTSSVEMCDDFVRSHGYGVPGPYALLSVTDNGIGMDEEIRAHIFDPFFTTKEVGKGTGLGLAIVYGIVTQHNGYLDIHTEVGVGTTFDIYLPLLLRDALPSAPSTVTDCCYRGTETVLVAEDAPEVRMLTTKVLEQSGYHVIEAVDGHDALLKFAANRKSIDLVIMDIIMPKMNGTEAFSEIAKINAEIKVLFTSGYTPEALSSKMISFGTDNFLAKPSSPQALLKKVRELLAA